MLRLAESRGLLDIKSVLDNSPDSLLTVNRNIRQVGENRGVVLLGLDGTINREKRKLGSGGGEMVLLNLTMQCKIVTNTTTRQQTRQGGEMHVCENHTMHAKT